MKKLLFWLVFLPTSSYAMSFSDIVGIDLMILEKTTDYIESDCSPQTDLRESFVCNSDMYGGIARLSKSELQRQYGRNMKHLEDQKILLITMLREKKISSKTYDEKMKEVSSIKSREMRDFFKRYDQKIEEYKQQIANRVSELNALSNFLNAQRNTSYIDTSRFYSVPVIKNNAPQTQNYFINGRSISCTTIGNVTSCI
jgi:uncharacterized protein YeaO (DUF488 family)